MDIFDIHTTNSPQETQALGRELATVLVASVKASKHQASDNGATVICLYGELGSGKTTLTQGFALGLGITERITSPTFLLMKEYPLDSGKRLYHLDLYRSSDVQSLGLTEIFGDTTAIVLIEWAEKIKDILPKDRIELFFETREDERHVIRIVSF